MPKEEILIDILLKVSNLEMDVETAEKRILKNIIDIIGDMEWGVMDNSIDAQELILKLKEKCK